VVASEWPFGAPDAVTSVREYHPATGQLARVLAPDRSVGWSWIATVADEALWDDQGWRVTVRQVQLARDAGALDQLPILLDRMSVEAVWNGDFTAATSLIAEAEAVCEATGAPLAPVTAMMLAAFRGREAEAAPLTQSTIAQATAGGQGLSVTVAHWMIAVLYNGLGRYEEALAEARHASEHKHVYVSARALPELIEAAARTGNPHVADEALDLLAETTRAGGADSGLGIEARSRALLNEGGSPRDTIARRSVGLAARGAVPNLPAPTCCMASGCAASAVATRHGSSCAPPTACWTRWAWRLLRSAPGASCMPSARPSASALPRRRPVR
jgi:hypothetical protein